MSDIIEKNDTPEPSESSQVAAFGGQATEATAVEVPSYMPRRTLGQLLRGDLGFVPVMLTLIVVVIYFTITTNGEFLHPENLSNLVGQIVTFGVLGLGVTMVLLLGEIDLSIGAVSVFCSVVMAVLASHQWFLCSSIACSLIYCDTRCIHLLFRTSAPSTRNTEYAHHQQ